MMMVTGSQNDGATSIQCRRGGEKVAAIFGSGEEGSRRGGSHTCGASASGGATRHREQGAGLKHWVGESSRWAGTMKN
jgi:hypothetical protein